MKNNNTNNSNDIILINNISEKTIIQLFIKKTFNSNINKLLNDFKNEISFTLHRENNKRKKDKN